MGKSLVFYLLSGGWCWVVDVDKFVGKKDLEISPVIHRVLLPHLIFNNFSFKGRRGV